MRADRRKVLLGAGALMLSACSREVEAVEAEVEAPAQTLDLDLSDLEARHGGRLGLAIASGASNAAWRGDERFVYCSTFKMYLAAATLLRVQAGQERLDRAVPITAADMINHAPTTEKAVGSTLTIEQLMQATVELSDNPAANILIREMGGLDALRAFYRGIGDDSTRVDRLEPEMNRADGDKDTITPIQSVQNISRLLVSPETPLNPASKALLMRWNQYADGAGPHQGGRSRRLDRGAQDRHRRLWPDQRHRPDPAAYRRPRRHRRLFPRHAGFDRRPARSRHRGCDPSGAQGAGAWLRTRESCHQAG